MEESEDNMSSEDVQNADSPSTVKSKPKKRSLVERELETNLTARVTSPVTAEGLSISRYGRARRLKSGKTNSDFQKGLTDKKSPESPRKSPSIAYKMHASNSPLKTSSPINTPETCLDNQIDNIYHENKSLSRFGTEEVISPSPAKKFPKVYIRKDLIQKREPDETIMLIKNIFSPTKSSEKRSRDTHLNNVLERSSERFNLSSAEKSSDKFTKSSNGYCSNPSVVKTLDFDSKKKKKDSRDSKILSKNELFELEAKCAYQVGDLAWARMGTFPFWPSIVTRDPADGIFVKKKLFGRIERDVIHVTFFGDNGRRGWIVDTMLRKYLGQLEFETTREQFTAEDKKKDPRLYAAFFVSDKKQALWNTSVEEAEMLLREPKRLRIDIFNDMLHKSRALKPNKQKSSKITRTDSDVSLSESLYDSLFSEDDGKSDNNDSSRRSRNKSLDVFEVVTACLDNMAAKSGMTKIQRQSHMDRWLQKAKSKTPEKTQVPPLKLEKETKITSANKKKKTPHKEVKVQKSYSLRRSGIESQRLVKEEPVSSIHKIIDDPIEHTSLDASKVEPGSEIGIRAIVSLSDKNQRKEQADIDLNNCDDLSLVEEAKETNCTTDTKLQAVMDVDLPNVNKKETDFSLPKSPKNEAENNLDEVDYGEPSLKDDLKSERHLELNRVQSKIQEDQQGTQADIINISCISCPDPNNITEAEMSERKSTDETIFLDKPKAITVKSVTAKEIDEFTDDRWSSVVDVNYEASLKENTLGTAKNDSDIDKISTNTQADDINVCDSQLKTAGTCEKRIPLNEGIKNSEEDMKDLSDVNVSNSSELVNHDDSEDTINNTFLDNCDEPSSIEIKNESQQLYDIHGKKPLNVTNKSIATDNDEVGGIQIKQIGSNLKLNELNVKTLIQENVDNNLSKTITSAVVLGNNIFIDDDSDDEPLPYSPLSVDLNKDENLDELNDVEPVFEENDKETGNLCNKEDDCQENVKEIKASMEELNHTGKKNSEIESETQANGLINTIKINGEIEQHYDSGESLGIGFGLDIAIGNNKLGKSIIKPTLGDNELQLHSDQNKNQDKPNEKTPKIETKESSLNNNNDIILHNVMEVDNMDEYDITQSKNVSQKPTFNGHAVEKELSTFKTKAVLKDAPIFKDTANDFDSNKDFKADNKRQLRSTKNMKAENPLDNAEFIKYFELRQDYIMDENPELCHDEIVAYLYKTWLYEENIKTDTKKNEGIRQTTTVKGLEKETSKKRRNKLSLKRNKIDMFEKPIKSKGSEEFCADNNIEEPLAPQESTDNKQELLTKEQCVELTATEERARNENDEVLQMASTSSMSIEADDDKNDTVLFPKLILQESVSECVDASIKLYCQEIVRHSKENLPSAENNQEIDTSIEIYCQDIIRQGEENLTSHETEQNNIEPNNIVDKDKHLNVNKISDDATDTIQNAKDKCDNKDIDTESLDSEDSEAPLIECKLRSLRNKTSKEEVSNKEVNPDIAHIEPQDNASSVQTKPKQQKITEKKHEKSLSDPEFVKYLELRQDALIDENPQLLHDEVVSYLYKAWLYEDKNKSELVKSEEALTSNLVKGLNDNVQPPKKIKRNKIKTEKVPKGDDIVPKEKPKRKISRACYNEEYSDIEEEIEYFEIFRSKRKGMIDSAKNEQNKGTTGSTDNKLIESIKEENGIVETMTEAKDNETEEPQIVEVYDVAEYYFWNLTQPKTNVFKGLLREKVCEICENTNNLIKCRACSGMFHNDCVKRQTDIAEMHAPAKTRKKKKKPGRKPKGFDDSGNQDEGSEDLNASIEEIPEVEGRTVDADLLEAQLTAKMKELLETNENRNYDSYSSDEGVDWKDSVPGKCEIVEVKLKPRLSQTDYSNFKCHNCQKYDTPICFVCKSAVSKTNNSVRQKCQVAHCHKYYHLECLDQWPQTQFNGTEFCKNKKIKAYFEPLTCPRHVCHTCVSDDPRGCKTRFSGDKLARCVKCPATYHSFTKCLPAGSQILTASYIICPRHYEHRPGKVPCHVNTGWCFLCALGGSLICCEYCPTSFHAECLNIKPPEGGYMCEDCETGRLPLYGEMVWVKLGHYRWWPGLILHPSEIPENIMAVKHSAGEFVVRFFGQYDHYWVNRGRVFPFQEGDSGRISSQKSKIDAAFTMAMEHAQRACQILKNAPPNEEESTDIASSLLPPHYVKLKVNKPCGSLVGRRPEDPETSLTQCECNPMDEEPCGAYSQCINRMLLTECGPICKAGDRCNNRAFEKRLYPKLVPYRTPSRGWGLKTLEDIKAGQFVIEYVGELIDEEEFRRRMDRKHEIRDENFYFLTLDKERMIDAGPKGNLARFMNHCCEPNCETQKWTVLGDVRVGLFALYDIPANSEVTFNYNLECAGIDKKRCMCGAKRCSGYIGAKPKQDDQSKKPKRPYNKKKKPESPLDTKPKPKRPLGRPPKPKPLTEIEKDLLIINSAASSDDSSKSVTETDKPQNPLKRRRVNFSTEEVSNGSESPSAKKPKVDNPVGD